MESEKFILWKQRLEEIKQSDLNVDEWCKQNQISKHAYYYWHKKILDSINNVNKTTCFAEVTHLMEASHNNSGAADGVVIINRYCSLSIHNKNEAALAAVFIKELVKKQKLQLSEKDNMLREKDEVIRRQQIQIENMTQALLHARKKMFGRSSEVSTGYEQLCLFEETTELAKALLKDQENIVVKEHKRTPRKLGIRKEMLAGLPKEIEEYVIDAEEKCSVCGGELKVIGKEIVRTEVQFKPATLLVKQIVRQVAKCMVCGSNENDRPKHIQKASVPAKVLPHSIATHSLVAQIMYQKFGMGLPFARQEKDFYRMGLVLSRANMAHWTIRCSDEWLMPVYDRIHQELIQKCEILHMDETRIQVNT